MHLAFLDLESRMKMKLLIDARNLGSKPSGIGMYAYNWIKALVDYDDMEIHVIVDVIESPQIKEFDASRKITVHSYGRTTNKSANVFAYFKYVKRLIKEIKPDIFWEINNLAPVRIKNPYGKYIITIHDMFPLTMPGCFGRIYPYYFKYGLRKTINCVDGIVYNSNCTKKETEMFFPKAKEKKCVISYIIIPPIPEMDVEDKDYFLYMGNLEKRKGTDILLNAYELYVQQGGTRELVIAGKIREDDIRQRVHELEDKIPSLHYMGYVDDDTRTRLYRECGCFVFPSRAEGFGMPVIEAMQCGKNVIASDLEIFNELVGNAIEVFSLDDSGASVGNLTQKMLKNISVTADGKRSLFEEANKYSVDKLKDIMQEFFSALL